jgi:hypothetical protein
MQNGPKVQLLKNKSGAILSCILAILACNSVHDFEKYYIPDRICFSRRIVFRTNACCADEKAMVRSSIQAICLVLADMCAGQPG